MATCKTCGCRDDGLPENWKSWDCLQCFTEKFVTYVSPLNIQVLEKELADMAAKKNVLQVLVTDRYLDLALRKATLACSGRR